MMRALRAPFGGPSSTSGTKSMCMKSALAKKTRTHPCRHSAAVSALRKRLLIAKTAPLHKKRDRGCTNHHMAGGAPTAAALRRRTNGSPAAKTRQRRDERQPQKRQNRQNRAAPPRSRHRGRRNNHSAAARPQHARRGDLREEQQGDGGPPAQREGVPRREAARPAHRRRRGGAPAGLAGPDPGLRLLRAAAVAGGARGPHGQRAQAAQGGHGARRPRRRDRRAGRPGLHARPRPDDGALLAEPHPAAGRRDLRGITKNGRRRRRQERHEGLLENDRALQPRVAAPRRQAVAQGDAEPREFDTVLRPAGLRSFGAGLRTVAARQQGDARGHRRVLPAAAVHRAEGEVEGEELGNRRRQGACRGAPRFAPAPRRPSRPCRAGAGRGWRRLLGERPLLAAAKRRRAAAAAARPARRGRPARRCVPRGVRIEGGEVGRRRGALAVRRVRVVEVGERVVRRRRHRRLGDLGVLRGGRVVVGRGRARRAQRRVVGF